MCTDEIAILKLAAEQRRLAAEGGKGNKGASGATSDAETCYPTIPFLHEKIQSSNEFPRWGLTTTRTIILSLGFK